MNRSAIILTVVLSVFSGCSRTTVFPAYVQPVAVDGATGDTVTVKRCFISHRGVDLKCTVAGENSLEAVRLAGELGFDCIETDVRLTSDSVLVCMHDKTLNRTCLYADGTELEEQVGVADVTFEELRSKYRIKAAREDMRSQVPTLEEYLKACRDAGLLVFIEPKLNDGTGEHYKDIMRVADGIFGRKGYIITSNNFANDVIRNTLKINDVRLMGILYQTTFENIRSLGNTIMAISTTRYGAGEYAENVNNAVEAGFLTESNTDNFHRMDMINKARINYISTDLLLPDYCGKGEVLADIRTPDKWDRLPSEEITLGAYFLEMTYKGSAEVTLGDESFSIDGGNGLDSGDGYRTICHQLLRFRTVPKASIQAQSPDFNVMRSRLRYVAFIR